MIIRRDRNYYWSCIKFSLIIFTSFFLIGGCNGNDQTTSVRQIGTLTSVLSEGIALSIRLIPFEPGGNTPIILEGITIFDLNETQKQALVDTYDSGFSIVLLDADESEINEFVNLIDDALGYTSESHDLLFAYIARNEGIYRAQLLAEPLPGPDSESTLDTAINIIVKQLRARPKIQEPPLLGSDESDDLENYPVAKQIFSIPQPLNGAFNTTISVYAAHECLTSTDHYVVNSISNWTPGSSLQMANRDQVDSGIWFDGENDVCPNREDGGSDDTACRFINYPKFYRVEMQPLSSGTITQLEAAPQASQGVSSTYTSGITFKLGGNVSIKNGPKVTGGVRWTNLQTVTIPPTDILAGNTENSGAFWQFEYCTSSNTDVDTCVNTIQTANPSGVCQDQLGPPQQGQTVNGKFSNTAQTVHWSTELDTREEADTFDIKVTFQAALADTNMRVWWDNESDPGTCSQCSIFAGCCNCKADTTSRNNDATQDVTFNIEFPEIDCDEES